MTLLAQTIDIAKLAGAAILDIYTGDGVAVGLKADDSPLTAADLASHRVICDALNKLTPEYPVLSEESDALSVAQRSTWGRYWLIDPLDGTKEFLKRNGEFTVNIALIEHGRPILGVVYAPALALCYYAQHEVGAFVQRGSHRAELIKVSTRTHGEAIKVVASRSHSDLQTLAILAQLGACDTISLGSSLKLCWVAEGHAHFYPRLGPTMEWDTAAAHVIVNEAGGTVCDRDAYELRYNKADMHNPAFFVFAKADDSYLNVMKVSS